jgi:hypothetical protein
MTEKETIKNVVQNTLNDLKREDGDKLKLKIRGIIQSILEKIEGCKKSKEELQGKIKNIEEDLSLLNRDLEDLKNGRLDLVEERHSKNERAKEISPIYIELPPNTSPPQYNHTTTLMLPWNQPYFVGDIPNEGITFCSSTANVPLGKYVDMFDEMTELTGKLVSELMSGTYDVFGKKIDIRPRIR